MFHQAKLGWNKANVKGMGAQMKELKHWMAQNPRHRSTRAKKLLLKNVQRECKDFSLVNYHVTTEELRNIMTQWEVRWNK
jgi:hypothetical protein